jgi:hypothetical protein
LVELYLLWKACRMSAKKLSDTDKQEILEQYRQLGETTLTIANRYGVSNSTISRMLKTTLPPDEYELLIQQKRAARVQGGLDEESVGAGVVEDVRVAPTLPEPAAVDEPKGDGSRRRRKRSSADESFEDATVQLDLPLDGAPPAQEKPRQVAWESPPIAEDEVKADTTVEAIGLDEEEFEADDDLEDEVDDDLDDDDLDDDDFDDEDDFEDDLALDEMDDALPLKSPQTQILGQVQVLPFAQAALPKTCYLVVDRAAELITRPLRDFGDLGQIPVAEVQERTLPVFDNHRVARRFANRSQRVMKIPDSKMLQRVSSYLHAKGITRVLLDGQVYSL